MHIAKKLTTAAVSALALATLGACAPSAREASTAGAVTVPWAPAAWQQAAATTPVDLAQQVSDYVAPFRQGAPYERPTAAERDTLATGVGQLVAGRRDDARRTLAGVGWTTTLLRDSATGRLVVRAADASATREAGRGWGRVYVDVSAKPRFSVQVPHPVFDMHSERVAAAIFRAAPGGVLVVAGAHRRVVDPAHDGTTVFAAAIDRLRLPGVQVHGFAADSLPGFDAIPSPGAAHVTSRVRAQADALAAAGFRVCRVWEGSCGALGGTTNVESRFAAAHGIPFLHLELAPALRADPKLIARVAATVAAGL